MSVGMDNIFITLCIYSSEEHKSNLVMVKLFQQ